VASLPAEEQVAAAVAGKDELKLAAKRVRESKRKPREEPAAAPAQEAPVDETSLEALRHRVAVLTEENALLRRQVTDLQARLAGQAAAETAPF
jgi:predicted RNase H-like nuclease (RuvC/YqgF family)